MYYHFTINAFSVVLGVVTFKSIWESLETEPIKHERHTSVNAVVFFLVFFQITNMHVSQKWKLSLFMSTQGCCPVCITYISCKNTRFSKAHLDLRQDEMQHWKNSKPDFWDLTKVMTGITLTVPAGDVVGTVMNIFTLQEKWHSVYIWEFGAASQK